jgi:hypothetical protein
MKSDWRRGIPSRHSFPSPLVVFSRLALQPICRNYDAQVLGVTDHSSVLILRPAVLTILFLGPLVCIAWGVYRWASTAPYFDKPKWRFVAALFGFALATGSSLTAIGVSAYTNLVFLTMHQTVPYWDPFVYHSANLGFQIAALTLLLAAIGKGVLRLPTTLMSGATGFVWLIEILTR